ncbi:MAG: hypothetical protein RIS35_2390 [Pseudomonadota bacterium]|jgi:O-antigen ligase
MKGRRVSAPDRTPRRVALGVFCAWLVLLPLPFGAARTWALALVLPPLFLLAVAVSWSRRSWSDALHAFLLRPPGLFFLGFLLCVAIHYVPWAGTATSAVPYRTGVYLLIAFGCTTAAWLTTVLIRSDADLRWLMVSLVAGGLLQAILASVLLAWGQTFTVLDSEYGAWPGVATGTYANRNHLAGYLNMALAAGCGIMVGHLASPRGNRRWALVVRDWLELMLGGKARLRLVLVMLVIVLIATRSRMGNAAFFAALVVATCVYAAFRRQQRRGLLLFAASVVAVDLLLVGAWVGVDRVMERIGNTPLAGSVIQTPVDTGRAAPSSSPSRANTRLEQSLEDRIEPALDALAIVRDHPWLGTGGGTFYLVYMAYQPNWEGYYNHAHNDFLEIAADTGLVGLALLLAIAAHAFWTAVRLIRERSNPVLHAAGFATVMSVTAMALHALVDFNLHIPANAITFCVMLALPWAAQRLRARERSEVPSADALSFAPRAAADVR